MAFPRILKNLLLFDLWLIVFALDRIVHFFDRGVWRLLRFDRKTQYVRRGACQRSGMCCQTLGIEVPNSWLRRPRLLSWVGRWYASVHNFQSVGEPQGRLLPMSCGYLRGQSDCSIYPYRPKLCREFPQVGFFGKIELHRGCGFWFVERSKLGGFGERLAEKEHEETRGITSP